VAAAVGPAAVAVSAVEVPVAIGETIPAWLKRQLTAADLERISQAVRRAETNSAGEIVPMLVRSSTRFGHVSVILTLSLFSMGLFLDLQFLPTWAHFPAWVTTPILLLVCYLLSLPLSRIPRLCRFLTLDQDEIHSVAVRAEIEFYRGSYTQTEGRTAVLLFVSWLERRAIVLADQAIAAKVPPETWKQVVDILVKGLSEGRFVEAWEKAIERTGAVLAEKFPGPRTSNQVVDNLVIKD
jgi:putative membrane protein